MLLQARRIEKTKRPHSKVLDVKVKNLDVGVEIVSRLRPGDIPELPEQGALRPGFLPVPQLLLEVLRRPSLDERLPDLLQPERLDPELLNPAVLASVRLEARNLIAARALSETGSRKKARQRASASSIIWRVSTRTSARRLPRSCAGDGRRLGNTDSARRTLYGLCLNLNGRGVWSVAQTS